MAQSTDIKTYAEEFFELARMLERGEEFKTKSKNKAELHRLRFTFYGFRKAAILCGFANEFTQLSASVATLSECEDNYFELTISPASGTSLTSLLSQGLTQSHEPKPVKPADITPTITPAVSAAVPTQDDLISSMMKGKK